MNDEPYSLFDSVLALRTEWQLLAETYESHAVGLVHSSVDPRGMSPGVFRGQLREVIEHSTMAQQLRACIVALDDCLEEAESRAHDRPS